jgi:hypothetical protein
VTGEHSHVESGVRDHLRRPFVDRRELCPVLVGVLGVVLDECGTRSSL